MKTLRALMLLGPWVAAGALLLAPSARADTRLGLGADYWIDNETGIFSLTGAIDTPVSRVFSVGGRFGLLLTSSPTEVGIPLDLLLRFEPRRSSLYLEALAGPWILFVDEPVRAHVAFGFGVRTGVLSAGLEVGYLDPDPVLGLRLAFNL